MKLFKILFLSYIALYGVAFAENESSECTANEVKVVSTIKSEFVACTKYYQKLDKKYYIALLEMFPESNNELTGSTISHFYKNTKGNYTLLFQESGLGDYFRPLTLNAKKYKLLVYDFNQDGRLDVSFRSYIVPMTKVQIHSFSYKSNKISSIGMFEYVDGKTEFYPYFIFAHDDEVVISKNKISSFLQKKLELEYELSGNHYILKIDNIPSSKE